MPGRRWRKFGGDLLRNLVGLLVGLILAPSVGFAQEIWLSPSWGQGNAADYMDLFKPDAPWQRVASHVRLFGISVQTMDEGSSTELQALFAGLHQRGIGLGLDMLALTGPPGPGTSQCGYHVEGYSAFGDSLRIANRIKSLGGNPALYGMDEPLFYGHYYTGPNACQSSIVDIARDAAIKVRQIRTVFPGIPIGDGEPIQAFPDATWQADLKLWLDTFKAETGQPLSLFGVDVGWRSDTWRTRVPILRQILHERGTRLLIIYNGEDTAKSDDQWARQAEAHFKAVEADPSTVPDIACFSTWVSHPSRVLPESNPDTFTGVVSTYLTWRQSRGGG